jgi:transcriptional regulator with XRE-family HTH domain
MSIGEKIKSERLRLGMSQSKLGEMLQVTQQAVGKWEKNLSEPDSQTLNRLAMIFGVSVDYLVGLNELTPQEVAAGLSKTKTITITPIEDDMLYVFRQVGKKYGEKGQRSIIVIAENMINLKDN